MSTDTRAALVERIEDVCNHIGRRETPENQQWILAILTSAIDALARSAPEERGEGERLTLTVDQVWAFEQIHNAGLSDDQYEAWQIVWRYLTRAASLPAPVEGGKRYNLSAPNGGNHQLSAPVEGERRSRFKSLCCERGDHGNCGGASGALDSPLCGCRCHTTSAAQARPPEARRSDALVALANEIGEALGVGSPEAAAVYEILRKRLTSHPVQGEPCHIVEYDGAYRCLTHSRTWGAVTHPDDPCAHPVQGASAVVRVDRNEDGTLDGVVVRGEAYLEDLGDGEWSLTCGDLLLRIYPGGAHIDEPHEHATTPVQGAGGGERETGISGDKSLPGMGDVRDRVDSGGETISVASPAPSAPEEEP